jgi:hypothetical protein
MSQYKVYCVTRRIQGEVRKEQLKNKRSEIYCEILKDFVRELEVHYYFSLAGYSNRDERYTHRESCTYLVQVPTPTRVLVPGLDFLYYLTVFSWLCAFALCYNSTCTSMSFPYPEGQCEHSHESLILEEEGSVGNAHGRRRKMILVLYRLR